MKHKKIRKKKVKSLGAYTIQKSKKIKRKKKK